MRKQRSSEDVASLAVSRESRVLSDLERKARLAGLLKYEHRKKGITLSTTDVTIAAVAIQHHLMLLTDNIKDFPMKEVVLYPLPKGVRGAG